MLRGSRKGPVEAGSKSKRVIEHVKSQKPPNQQVKTQNNTPQPWLKQRLQILKPDLRIQDACRVYMGRMNYAYDLHGD